MFMKNACLIIIVLSLIFILAQQELMYIVFSLLLLIGASLGFLSFYGVEFLILIIFIIYIGVIAVLFLFTVIIYNLPKVEISSNSLGLIILGVGFFLLIFASDNSWNLTSLMGVDLTYFIEFFNEYFKLIVLCGLLLLISIITAVIVINTLEHA